jgi:hypothetical protein
LSTSNAVVDIPSRLESLLSREFATQQTDRETHLVVLKEQTVAIGAIDEGITRLSGALETTRTTIQATSSASANSHLETHALLRQMLQQLTGLSLGVQGPSRVVEVQDDGVTRSPLHEEAHLADLKSEQPCKELTDIITRLCNRVTDNELQGRIVLREAQDIICDLLLALEVMKSEEFLQAACESGLVDRGVCSTCTRRHISDLRTTLTEVSAALVPARQVAVNDTGKGLEGDCCSAISGTDKRVGRAQQRASGTYYQSQWTLSSHQISKGTSISVVSRRRARRIQQLSHLMQSHPGSLAEMEEKEVTTSISLVSILSQPRHAIKVNIRQTHSDDGMFSAIPQLLVYNVLPANSPVFSIVQQGRLREFQALLCEGKASLRDQDEHGASLLFVSVPVYDT